MTIRFYTYLHRKGDTNEVFYVGKGQRKRATCVHNRNRYWHNTVAKHGFTAEVLGHFDTEAEAHAAEVRLIAELKASGVRLVNLTGGGEGASGITRSAETRQKISAAKRGRKLTAEHRQKISDANRRRYEDPAERHTATQHLKGKPSHRRGKKMSAETRVKMSASQKERWAREKTVFYSRND